MRIATESRQPVTWIGHGFRWYMPDAWQREQEWMRDASRQGAQFFASARIQPIDRKVVFKRTTFFNGLETWRDVFALAPQERLAKLADPSLRPALRHAIDNPQRAATRGQILPQIRWDALFVEQAMLPKNKALEGRQAMKIAKERSIHVADLLADMAVEENLETVFRLHTAMPEDDIQRDRLLQGANVMVGNSDSGAHINSDCTAGEVTYFIKRYALDRKIISLEEAVRRWTWMPASMAGFTDRGLLREGMAADIVVFSPSELDVPPTEMAQDVPGGETRIVQKARGITHTIVNGRVALRGNRHTGERAGRVLRRRG
ncbi:MAG: amidohydrolase family protein [Chloroflexi bacterium]|nr:amidohydrolase family protein [Chloroflexota bacterium]